MTISRQNMEIETLKEMLAKTRQERDDFVMRLTELERNYKQVKAELDNEVSSHNWLKEKFQVTNKALEDTRFTLSEVTTERDSLRVELEKIRDLVLNIGVLIEPVVQVSSPLPEGVRAVVLDHPDKVVEVHNTIEDALTHDWRSSKPVYPEVVVDDKGFPHHPETGQFVSPEVLKKRQEESKEDSSESPLKTSWGY